MSAGFTLQLPGDQQTLQTWLHEFFEGTSEIQRLIIGRAISGHQIP